MLIRAVFGLNKHQKYIQRYWDTIIEDIKSRDLVETNPIQFDFEAIL